MSNNKQNKVTEISESIFFGISHGKSTNEPTENDYVDQPLKNKIKIMSNNKQSSIDWLASEISIYLNFDQRLYLKELLEQAKAMHKEEIIKAVTFGQNNHTVMISRDLIIATEYYNETFGRTNENI